jgi:hypothetical protein
MALNMGSPGMDSKIFDGIVKFVPIQMMDNFTGLQNPSQVHFESMPMFKFKRAINFDIPIPVLSQESQTFAVGEFLAKDRIAVSPESLIMLAAKTETKNGRIATLNDTKVGGSMLNEFSCFVSLHSVHNVPSFLTSITQIKTDSKRDNGANRVNSGEALTGAAEGNPEPSQEYTLGRCNDYWRGKAPLITSMSARLERDEIVYSPWKHGVSRYTTDKDGVGVTKPPAITVCCGFSAAGIVAETIAAGSYGLIQVYGLHSAALVRATTGAALKATQGSPLSLGLTASFALEAITTGYASTVVIKRYFPVAVSMGHITTRTVTGVATAVFIKAL